MQYRVGMTLKWIPDSKWEPVRYVTVESLRSRGCARLDNGWTVDEDGIAEGTRRIPGGRVEMLNLAFAGGMDGESVRRAVDSRPLDA